MKISYLFNMQIYSLNKDLVKKEKMLEGCILIKMVNQLFNSLI